MKHSLPIALTLLLLAAGWTGRAEETNTPSAPDQDPFLALERNNIFDESRVPHDYNPGRMNRPRVETITLCGTGVDDAGANAIFQGSSKWFKAGDTIKGLKIVRITFDSVTLAETGDDPPPNSASIAATNSITNALTNSSGSAPTNSASHTPTNSGSHIATNSASSAPTNFVTNTATNSGGNTATNSGGNTATNSAGSVPAHSARDTLVANSATNIFVLNMDTRPTLRREGDGPWRVSAYIATEPAPAAASAAATASASTSGAGDNDIIAKLRKKREQEEK
jgi:hypothetical protein